MIDAGSLAQKITPLRSVFSSYSKGVFSVCRENALERTEGPIKRKLDIVLDVVKLAIVFVCSAAQGKTN